MIGDVLGWALGAGVPLLYAWGLYSACEAVMKARTAQGATAWAISLLTVPFLALPLYWVFGRFKFGDYVRALRDFDRELAERTDLPRREVLARFLAGEGADERGEMRAFRALATLPFTRSNGARLLVDGRATFEAIFAGIDGARDYVFAQFYILRDDGIGRQFHGRLVAAAERGVRVHLLYDDIGSYDLPRRYVDELRASGARVSSFSGRRSWLGRFRLNFRNHRKLVVVDGRAAYAGGLNVGDEYLGRDPAISPWRDTHVELEGPVVQGVQYAFLKDWYYATGEVPDVTWEPTPCPEDRCALVLASGPADELETCGLLFAHAIESAERRLWLATPYFVPDGRVLGALQLAALRGVDVRVVMPRQTDSFLFKYVPYAYLPEANLAGVKVYLYEAGFMHQKVLLVDDEYAAVSTANLDNRSFRLNFELTVLLADEAFAKATEAMLERDLQHATRLTAEELTRHPFGFRLAIQTTRLLAPVL